MSAVSVDAEPHFVRSHSERRRHELTSRNKRLSRSVGLSSCSAIMSRSAVKIASSDSPAALRRWYSCAAQTPSRSVWQHQSAFVERDVASAQAYVHMRAYERDTNDIASSHSLPARARATRARAGPLTRRSPWRRARRRRSFAACTRCCYCCCCAVLCVVCVEVGGRRRWRLRLVNDRPMRHSWVEVLRIAANPNGARPLKLCSTIACHVQASVHHGHGHHMHMTSRPMAVSTPSLEHHVHDVLWRCRPDDDLCPRDEFDFETSQDLGSVVNLRCCLGSTLNHCGFARCLL